MRTWWDIWWRSRTRTLQIDLKNDSDVMISMWSLQKSILKELRRQYPSYVTYFLITNGCIISGQTSNILFPQILNISIYSDVENVFIWTSYSVCSLRYSTGRVNTLDELKKSSVMPGGLILNLLFNMQSVKENEYLLRHYICKLQNCCIYGQNTFEEQLKCRRID